MDKVDKRETLFLQSILRGRPGFAPAGSECGGHMDWLRPADLGVFPRETSNSPSTTATPGKGQIR